MFKKSLMICFLLLRGYWLPAQTKAHLTSRYAIIDPAYNSSAIYPEPGTKIGPSWIYGYTELESWKLQELRKQVKDAKLKVGYPGVYHKVYNAASFLAANKQGYYVKNLSFYADGDVDVFVNGKSIYHSPAKTDSHKIELAKPVLIKTLQFNLLTNGGPPCLLIQSSPFNTDNKTWTWKAGKENWQPAFKYPQLISGVLPHQNGLQELNINPVSHKGKLYDFGKELLGFVDIKASSKPQISVGESAAEALDTSALAQEQTNELILVKEGEWRSKVPLALRYVNLLSGTGASISCRALFHPEQYKGAFSSSDSLLTRIWMNSAYTLRLCMNDFLVDGIKRDRLPWAGDLAMSMLANAYSFADKEAVRRGLVVLGREGIKQQNINGIIDYSLWWVISQDLYQLYYADRPHLQREWPRIKDALNVLNSKSDSLGFINPQGTWVFIDWTDGNKNTALQVLWWWAQQSGAKLAERMGDQPTARLWRSRSAVLKKHLLEKAWSNSRSAWMNDPYHPDTISRHANILAVVSGMADNSQYGAIARVLQDTVAGAVGTPYMAGFENMALSRVGAISLFINNVRNYWGGMIEQGATTFWEAYNPAEKGGAKYAFYDRPYGKSLCHAWSSGPAALLPSELMGIHPLEDGWKVFSINPRLGSIGWIDATIPTPHGNIKIEVKNHIMTLQVPRGTIAKLGNKLIYGPQIISKTGI